MKRLYVLPTLVLAVMLPLFLAGPASAATLSGVQQLQVTARVLPMRRIIIDQTGQIVQITSNTSNNITPQVYLVNDPSGSHQPLTNTLYASYKKLVSTASSGAGILYQRELRDVLHKSS